MWRETGKVRRNFSIKARRVGLVLVPLRKQIPRSDFAASRRRAITAASTSCQAAAFPSIKGSFRRRLS